MTNAALKVKSIVQVDDLGWWQYVLLNTKNMVPRKVHSDILSSRKKSSVHRQNETW